MRQLSTDLRRHRVYSETNNGRKKYRHPHLPQLFYLVKSRNWNSVLNRTRTHSNEILCIEETSGDTPLHFACRLNPPENIVRALMPAIKEKNNEGATALHVAASHRCSADVIRALVQDNPSPFTTNGTALPIQSGPYYAPALSLTKIGRLPLHYACLSFRGLSVEAFKILLEATIDACVNLEKKLHAETDNDFQMNDFEWYDVTDASNWQSNAFTMQDHLGHTPLSLLFRRYRERVRCVINMLERNRKTRLDSNVAAAAVQDELGELWLKSRLMVSLMTQKRIEREGATSTIDFFEETCSAAAAAALEAAEWARQQYQKPNNNSDEDAEYTDDFSNGCKFRLVHASVGLTGYGCPPEMIRLAISVYPNQVREMDEDGNLPLHIACVASSFLPHPDHTSAWTFSDEASWQSGLSNLSFMSNDPNPFAKVIRTLVRIYPDAVTIPNCRGRLPLIAAIEGRKRTMNDGIKVLLEVYPAALESKDIDRKLYPLILSTVGQLKDYPGRKTVGRLSSREANSNKRVPTALFEMLRAKPGLLSLAIVNVVNITNGEKRTTSHKCGTSSGQSRSL